MQRLGIIGGTFDPIHCGHLLLATFVAEQLRLGRVLFVPAADPPRKDHRSDLAPAEDRWQMVRRAVAGVPGFEASRLELDRPGKSYTVDTLRQVRSQEPDSSLYLIIGRDNVSDMATWQDPEGILELCTVVAGSRVVAQRPAQAELAARILSLETPVIDLSSTAIRRRVAGGLPIRWMVPPPVEDYIGQQRLYLASTGEAAAPDGGDGNRARGSAAT